MIVRWGREADRQLLAAIAHIHSENRCAAATMYARIRQRAEQLERFPFSGRPGRVADTRELVVPGTAFIIVYKVYPNMVFVIGLIHAAQLYPPDSP